MLVIYFIIWLTLASMRIMNFSLWVISVFSIRYQHKEDKIIQKEKLLINNWPHSQVISAIHLVTTYSFFFSKEHNLLVLGFLPIHSFGPNRICVLSSAFFWPYESTRLLSVCKCCLNSVISSNKTFWTTAWDTHIDGRIWIWTWVV